jgi:transcriptional regulator with XRE-family HTH domain
MVDNARDFKGYNGVFAKRLREVMDETQTTQEILAKQTGLTRQTISQYMDGSVLPNVEKLYKICSYFNMTSDYLIGFTDSKSRDISDQLIQNTTGLSEAAIETLKKISHGRPNSLFSLPFDMGVINYIFSNQSFLLKLIKRLSKYYELRQEHLRDSTGRIGFSEEADYANYLLARLIEELAITSYDSFYLPYVDKKAKRKPGRRRKQDVPDNHDVS